jgi:hypothetical protein
MAASLQSTRAAFHHGVGSRVLIHATHASRDRLRSGRATRRCCFNPRGPCVPRPPFPRITPTRRFQSTRPVWVATSSDCAFAGDAEVSIHAARVGRDRRMFAKRWKTASFNPRGPCGSRQQHDREQGQHDCFNPRGPCGLRLCDSKPLLPKKPRERIRGSVLFAD